MYYYLIAKESNKILAQSPNLEFIQMMYNFWQTTRPCFIKEEMH